MLLVQTNFDVQSSLRIFGATSLKGTTTMPLSLHRLITHLSTINGISAMPYIASRIQKMCHFPIMERKTWKEEETMKEVVERTKVVSNASTAGRWDIMKETVIKWKAETMPRMLQMQ